MSDLIDAIIYHLAELRDELGQANLTDAARMAATARLQVETIRLLIDPTPEQAKALEAVPAAFDEIQEAVRRVGPDPRHTRIQKAFTAARLALDLAEATLTASRPSEKAVTLGL